MNVSMVERVWVTHYTVCIAVCVLMVTTATAVNRQTIAMDIDVRMVQTV